MGVESKEQYTILGYDKDADVHVCLAIFFTKLHTARTVAEHLASLRLRRESNDEPFDWIEVITEHDDICHHIAPCA